MLNVECLILNDACRKSAIAGYGIMLLQSKNNRSSAKESVHSYYFDVDGDGFFKLIHFEGLMD